MLPWRGDPGDLIAATAPEPGWLLRRLAATEPVWMREAACRKPEHRAVDFFPPRGQSTTPALAVCATCPVIEPCRRWACDPVTPLLAGIAGGMTANARRAAPRSREAST